MPPSLSNPFSLSLSLSLSVWENGVWGIGVIDTLLQFRPRAQFRPRIVRIGVSLKGHTMTQTSVISDNHFVPHTQGSLLLLLYTGVECCVL